MLTSNQIAYVAGLMDGDGCISMVMHKNRGKPIPYLHVNIGFMNGDIEGVRDLLRQLPGNCTVTKRGVFQWQAYGDKGVEAIKVLKPYLRHKNETAAAVIDFYDSDRQEAFRRVKGIIAGMSASPPRLSESHTGTVREPAAEELAYVTGFFDAEGCTWVAGNKHGPITLRVGLVQGDCRPLVWIADRFGGNVHFRTKKSSCCGYTHAWFLSGAQALRFLNQIKEGLKLKREEVDLVTKVWRVSGNSGGHDYLEANRKLRAERLKLQKDLQDLKKKWKGGAKMLSEETELELDPA